MMSKAAQRVMKQHGSAKTIPELDAAMRAWDELMEDPAELTYENSIYLSDLMRLSEAMIFRDSAQELGDDDHSEVQ